MCRDADRPKHGKSNAYPLHSIILQVDAISQAKSLRFAGAYAERLARATSMRASDFVAAKELKALVEARRDRLSGQRDPDGRVQHPRLHAHWLAHGGQHRVDRVGLPGGDARKAPRGPRPATAERPASPSTRAHAWGRPRPGRTGIRRTPRTGRACGASPGRWAPPRQPAPAGRECRAGALEVALEQGGELGDREGAQVLAVQPLELLGIEHAGARVHPLEREPLDQLGDGHHGRVVVVAPSHQHQVVDERLGQDAAVTEFLDRDGAVAFRELLLVGAEHHGQVRVGRRLGLERGVDRELARRRRQQVLAPNHVRDAHADCHRTGLAKR